MKKYSEMIIYAVLIIAVGFFAFLYFRGKRGVEFNYNVTVDNLDIAWGKETTRANNSTRTNL